MIPNIDGNISCIRQALESLSNGTEINIYIDHLGHAYLYQFKRLKDLLRTLFSLQDIRFECLAK